MTFWTFLRALEERVAVELPETDAEAAAVGYALDNCGRGSCLGAARAATV